MSLSRRWLWIFLGLLLLTPVIFYLLFWSGYKPFGTQLIPAKAAYDFNLIAQNKPVKLSNFSGKAVLIFFGYVNCPDVCPLTMLELSKIYKALTPQEQARVQILMITTDPERDTPELIGRYAKAFHPSFIGLTGSAEVVAKTAQAYWVFYQKEQITSPKQYLVVHNAAVFLINPKGQLELIYTKGKTAQTEKMVQDVRWALRGR